MRASRLSCHLLALLALLALAAPTVASGQSSGRGGPTAFVGLAVGGSNLPVAFAGCTSDIRSAAELRAGVAFGPFALEARGAGLLAGFDQCLIFLPEERERPGVPSTISYPFERGDAHATIEARLRYSPLRGHPLVIGGGMGRLAPQDVTYFVSSVGLRSGGRLRFAADLDHSWYRVPYSIVYPDPGTTSVQVTTGHHDWRTGVGVRLGLELPLW